jgi:hypothetical protein
MFREHNFMHPAAANVYALLAASGGNGSYPIADYA